MERMLAGEAVYESEQVWVPASEQLLEWDAGFHRLLLGDELRMTAFRAAIDEVIVPGRTVLDLGTGTGILAEWALRAGAETVYGIELNSSLLKWQWSVSRRRDILDGFAPSQACRST